MKSAFLAFAITLALAGCATTTTTSPTGRRQVVGAVSQEQLNQLGEQAFEQAKRETPQSSNAQQTAYVRCVVSAITRQAPSGMQTGWDVALFQKDEPNAFALPGGKVGVYTGIFRVAQNQDQLAAVIAHEIGHVISHHHDERITRQSSTQTGLSILGALIGSRYGQSAANTVTQVGGVAAQGLILLPNSRTQESEADVVGQQLMAKAGFDPRQAVNLWQNMIAVSQSRAPEFLSTHPDPQSRLNELNQRAAALMPVYQQAQAAGLQPRCG